MKVYIVTEVGALQVIHSVWADEGAATAEALRLLKEEGMLHEVQTWEVQS